MAFFDEEALGGGERQFRSWQDTFVRLTPAHPSVVQIIEPQVTKDNVVWKHWVPMAARKSGQRGVSVKCPGFDICPICQRNKELANRDSPDYIASTRRYVVNVLDLTPVKICPLCDTENYSAKLCSYCDSDLSAVEPAPPKVRLLERGKELFDHLKVIESTKTKLFDPNDPQLDREVFGDLYARTNPGEMIPVGITRFPITLVTDPKSRKPTPVAGEVNDLNWQDYTDQYIPLSEAYIDLEPDEIRELLRGGSLSEVLKSRRSNDDSLEPDVDEIPF